MLSLLFVLMPLAKAETRDERVNSEVCFYYRRIDYTRAEANAELRETGIKTDVDQYCEMSPRDHAHRAELIRSVTQK